MDTEFSSSYVDGRPRAQVNGLAASSEFVRDDAVARQQQQRQGEESRMLMLDYYLVFIHFFGLSINPDDYSELVEEAQRNRVEASSSKLKFAKLTREHIFGIANATRSKRPSNQQQQLRRQRFSVVARTTISRAGRLKGGSQQVDTGNYMSDDDHKERTRRKETLNRIPFGVDEQQVPTALATNNNYNANEESVRDREATGSTRTPIGCAPSVELPSSEGHRFFGVSLLFCCLGRLVTAKCKEASGNKSNIDAEPKFRSALLAKVLIVLKFYAITLTTLLAVNHCIVLVDYVIKGSKVLTELLLELRLVITKFSALIFVLTWHKNRIQVRQLIQLVKSTTSSINCRDDDDDSDKSDESGKQQNNNNNNNKAALPVDAKTFTRTITADTATSLSSSSTSSQRYYNEVDSKVLRWWLMCVCVSVLHFSLSEAEINTAQHLWQWLDDYSMHQLNNETISTTTLYAMASFDNYIYTIHVYGTRLIGASIICIVCSLQTDSIKSLDLSASKLIREIDAQNHGTGKSSNKSNNNDTSQSLYLRKYCNLLKRSMEQTKLRTQNNNNNSERRSRRDDFPVDRNKFFILGESNWIRVCEHASVAPAMGYLSIHLDQMISSLDGCKRAVFGPFTWLLRQLVCVWSERVLVALRLRSRSNQSNQTPGLLFSGSKPRQQQSRKQHNNYNGDCCGGRSDAIFRRQLRPFQIARKSLQANIPSLACIVHKTPPTSSRRRRRRRPPHQIQNGRPKSTVLRASWPTPSEFVEQTTETMAKKDASGLRGRVGHNENIVLHNNERASDLWALEPRPLALIPSSASSIAGVDRLRYLVRVRLDSYGTRKRRRRQRRQSRRQQPRNLYQERIHHGLNGVANGTQVNNNNENNRPLRPVTSALIEEHLAKLAHDYELIRASNQQIDSCFGHMLLIQFSLLFLMSCIDVVYFSIEFNPNTKTKYIIVSGMILLWWPYFLLYKFASDIESASKELLITVRRLARLSLVADYSRACNETSARLSSSSSWRKLDNGFIAATSNAVMDSLLPTANASNNNNNNNDDDDDDDYTKRESCTDIDDRLERSHLFTSGCTNIDGAGDGATGSKSLNSIFGPTRKALKAVGSLTRLKKRVSVWPAQLKQQQQEHEQAVGDNYGTCLPTIRELAQESASARMKLPLSSLEEMSQEASERATQESQHATGELPGNWYTLKQHLCRQRQHNQQQQQRQRLLLLQRGDNFQSHPFEHLLQYDRCKANQSDSSEHIDATTNYLNQSDLDEGNFSLTSENESADLVSNKDNKRNAHGYDCTGNHQIINQLDHLFRPIHLSIFGVMAVDKFFLLNFAKIVITSSVMIIQFISS